MSLHGDRLELIGFDAKFSLSGAVSPNDYELTPFSSLSDEFAAPKVPDDTTGLRIRKVNRTPKFRETLRAHAQ